MTASMARAVSVPGAERPAGVVPSPEITLKLLARLCQPSPLLTCNAGGGATALFLQTPILSRQTPFREEFTTKTPTKFDGIQST